MAVNYEEVDLEENDDNSLCRYEFLEIIVRMAKIKYKDKGVCETVAEATQKLIEEYIIPNSKEHMPWQGFRKNRLWNLDCDDLFKANISSLNELF